MGELRNQACVLVAMALCLVMTDTVMTQAQDYSAEELARRTLKRRAVEAVIWGMPAVNFGPGNPEFAHKQDEFVPIAHLYSCLDQMTAWLT